MTPSTELKKKIAEFNLIAGSKGLLPIKITPFYLSKIEEEIAAIGFGGPLFRCAISSVDRFQTQAPGETIDFVSDGKNIKTDDSIIQKYHNRVLFLPTQSCAGHCQYCFRTNLLSKTNSAQSSIDEKITKLTTYLAKHPHIDEVILSGGDPITLSAKILATILLAIKKTGIPNIRIHTRSLIYDPTLLTKEKIKIMADANVRLVHHVVHPYEICATVEEKISQLNQAGIRSYNQFPILRQINDHVEVLKLLLTRLDELRIRNLSMFVPEPVIYSSEYRLSLKRLFALMDALNWSTSSWINSTRLVLDSRYGKVRKENLISLNPKTGLAKFLRENREITYPDFPEKMDIPGDIKKLLWKSSRRRNHSAP